MWTWQAAVKADEYKLAITKSKNLLQIKLNKLNRETNQTNFNLMQILSNTP